MDDDDSYIHVPISTPPTELHGTSNEIIKLIDERIETEKVR
jgi:hypothetical protein